MDEQATSATRNLEVVGPITRFAVGLTGIVDAPQDDDVASAR